MTEPSWLKRARAELGVKEAPGAANNARVVQYFADARLAGIRQDSVPWCAAFVCAMLEREGIVSTRSAWALNFADWGEACGLPLLGSIGVKKRDGGGHVGFVVGANAKEIFLLGGNQGDRVSVAAFPREAFRAFRWPRGVERVSQNDRLPSSLVAARGVSEA